MTVTPYGQTAQSEALPKICLPRHKLILNDTIRASRICHATAKSVAEIGVSERFLEPTHAPIAWFFVGVRSPFLWALLAYLLGDSCSVMAARTRAPQGALDPKVSSYANLVRAVTRRLASFCGSDNLLTLEAAIMATIPTLAVSKTYTFLIAPRSCRLAELRRYRTVSTVACTEAEARSHLAGLPLVFLSRRPTVEVAA